MPGLTKEKLEGHRQGPWRQEGGGCNAEENRQALEKYTIDLTERAEIGKLDPVIGRDDDPPHHPGAATPHQEQPVLIGCPGVGKTAIVEGWPAHHQWRGAGRAEEQAVLSLDMGGAGGRCQVSRRVRGALKRRF